MKKTMGLISTLVLSTLMFTGCQNMSASDQRIGAAALGGAVGGGVGNHVGGGLGAGVGAAAGAGAVTSKDLAVISEPVYLVELFLAISKLAETPPDLWVVSVADVPSAFVTVRVTFSLAFVLFCAFSKPTPTPKPLELLVLVLSAAVNVELFA